MRERSVDDDAGMEEDNIFFIFLNVYKLSGQSYNIIDAVTSASGKLNLIGGDAYPTFAVIRWKDAYNNGTEHLIKYGTTSSFGSQINLKPFSANTVVIDTLPDLTAGTRYYGQFYRTYKGHSYTTDFSFTTATPVATTYFTDASRLSLTGSSGWIVCNAAGREIGRIHSGHSLTEREYVQNDMPLFCRTGIYLVRYVAEPHHAKAATVRLPLIR